MQRNSKQTKVLKKLGQEAHTILFFTLYFLSLGLSLCCISFLHLFFVKGLGQVEMGQKPTLNGSNTKAGGFKYLSRKTQTQIRTQISFPLSLYLLLIIHLFYLSLVLKVTKIRFPAKPDSGFNDSIKSCKWYKGFTNQNSLT